MAKSRQNVTEIMILQNSCNEFMPRDATTAARWIPDKMATPIRISSILELARLDEFRQGTLRPESCPARPNHAPCHREGEPSRKIDSSSCGTQA